MAAWAQPVPTGFVKVAETTTATEGAHIVPGGGKGAWMMKEVFLGDLYIQLYTHIFIYIYIYDFRPKDDQTVLKGFERCPALHCFDTCSWHCMRSGTSVDCEDP